MNTSTSATTSTNSLTVIQNLITQYTFTVIFILGNLTNVANIMVFLQKNLRSNACSWYFIVVSVGHLVFLYAGCLTRIIVAWSGFDLNRTSIIYCRIRIFFLAFGLLLARYFLCFISIDRWMVTSTSAFIRRLSSIKIARWLVLSGTSFCVLFCTNVPIWYRIEGSRGCVAAADTYFPLFFTIYNLVITIGPMIVMVLFSVLGLNNLRRSRRPQASGLTHTNMASTTVGQFQRKDIQFIKLSLMQVVVYILCTSFYGYTTTYAFITQSTTKTPQQAALDSFLNTIAVNISYFYMAVSSP